MSKSATIISLQQINLKQHNETNTYSYNCDWQLSFPRLAGICLRWVAIYTLGKFFTRKVTILNDHRVVQSGLYKYLRHPSYSGFLLGNLGLGFAFSNWISLIVIFVPTFAAALYRIHVEEKALSQALGSEYIDYCRATYRLIPKLY